jgi:hypothetical protein
MRGQLCGTVIPDAVIERLERAAEPRRERIAICLELLHGSAASTRSG